VLIAGDTSDLRTLLSDESFRLFDLHGSIANFRETMFGSHTLNCVLGNDFGFLLRKEKNAERDLVSTHGNGLMRYFAFLQTFSDIAQAFFVVLPLLAEFGLIPCDVHRLFLGVGRSGSEFTSEGSDIDLTFLARRYWEVFLTGLNSAGFIESPTDALAPRQSIGACHGWLVARRAEHVVSWRGL
jgi:hypothetical protein